MSTQAKNLAAKAEHGLKLYMTMHGLSALVPDIRDSVITMRNIISDLPKVPHFAVDLDLVDNKQLIPEANKSNLRLPYPKFTLEYDLASELPKERQEESMWVVAVVSEYIRSEGEQLKRNAAYPEDMGFIKITVIVGGTGGACFPCEYDLIVSSYNFLVDAETTCVEAYKQPSISSLYSLISTNRETKDQLLNIVLMQVPRVLTFLYLLSQRHTEVVPHQEKPSKKAAEARRKAKKLPLYETKTIKLHVVEKVQEGESRGGTHASPKQHDRMGHWRHLSKGKIWIRATTVGDPKRGRINKTYQLEN